MKKLLSMLLAIFMVMSLFCAVPVSAAGFTLPYVNYDFNDMTDDATANYGDSIGTWNSKTYIEGVAGGKALYLESAGTSGGSYISLALKDRSPAVMVTGEPFKISFWLKLNTEISKFADSASPAFQLCYTANGGAKGYKGYNFDAQKAALNTGEWVYYEQEIAAWDGKFGTYDTVENPDNAALVMTFRLGYENGTAPAALMDSVKNKYAIAIDDFRIEPVRTPYDPNATEEYVEPVNTIWENTNAYIDSSAGAYTDTTLGGVARKVYMAKVGGTTGDANNKYISVANANNTYSIHWTDDEIFVDYNKLYKITFWARAEDAANVGTKVNIRLLHEVRVDNTNDPSTNYANLGSQYEVYDGITLTQEWQKCEIWRKRNLSTCDRSRVRLYMEYEAASGTELHVGLDDIKIEEYPDVTNGAFEATSHGVETSHHSATPYAHNDSAKYVSGLYGWLAKDATVTAVTSGAHGGSQAAKVVTTAANGSIYQGMFFENGATKIISFYAKGEGSSIGQPVSVVMDRTATLVSAYDVYEVPEVETLAVTGEDGNANLTADWKKFTVAYSPNFTTFRSGITAEPTLAATQKIGNRQPLMKFKVGDGSAGYTYYLDDLTIRAPKVAHPYPYMSDYDLIDASTSTTAVPVENKATYVDYLADTEVSADSVTAVVTRIMIESKAGSNKYGTYATLVEESDIATLGETFTIPEGFAGRKIKISVQPFSANGAVGAHYEKVIGTIAKEFEVSMSVGTYDPASSSVDVTYSLLNNKVDNSTVRAIMFAMFYAEDGTLVKCVENPIVVANGAQVTNATFSPVSTPIETDLQSLTVASAKVFFWYTEGTDTPSVYNTTMVEVLPSENVVFPS